MSFDEKCFELAESFLEDYPSHNSETDKAKLAQRVQDTIEGELYS